MADGPIGLEEFRARTMVEVASELRRAAERSLLGLPPGKRVKRPAPPPVPVAAFLPGLEPGRSRPGRRRLP